MLQCPDCKSYGVYAIKRHWWQRLLNLPHRYDCHDCGQMLLRNQLLESKPNSLTTQSMALRDVG